MKPSLRQALEQLPPLDPRNRLAGSRPCKLCGQRAAFFDVVDFNKFCSAHDFYEFGAAGIGVPYFRCDSCGFLFTEFFDDWSTEEFSRFVYNSDYIKVDGEYASVRPLQSAEQMGRLFRGCESARLLDYGSGSGVFGRRLGEQGFREVENYDPFSSPHRPAGAFDFITCFEVIEHATDPIALIRDVASFMAPGAMVVFSQTLQPRDITSVRGSWWYLAPRNGHVSLYSAHALSVLAAAGGLTFHGGLGPYAFSSDMPSEPTRLVLQQFGPPIGFQRLYAPEVLADASAHAAWHGIEGSGAERYRWTAAERVEWPMPRQRPGTLLRVEIDFVNAIEPSYAERVQIHYGAVAAKVGIGQGRLFAEFRAGDDAQEVIALVAPPPRSPAELRGAPDPRRLGLAIPLRVSGEAKPSAGS